MKSLEVGLTIESPKIENLRENHFVQLGFCEHVSSFIDFNYLVSGSPLSIMYVEILFGWFSEKV